MQESWKKNCGEVEYENCLRNYWEERFMEISWHTNLIVHSKFHIDYY
jgi:hypothetical protein